MRSCCLNRSVQDGQSEERDGLDVKDGCMQRQECRQIKRLEDPEESVARRIQELGSDMALTPNNKQNKKNYSGAPACTAAHLIS